MLTTLKAARNRSACARCVSPCVAHLPFHRRRPQRPRNVLQVLSAFLTTPLLESCARCMVVPRCASDTDVRIFLVALQRGYVYRALSCLVLFLCRQTTQARVQPTFVILISSRRTM